jgi:sugar lactone lactonase YvrE
MKRALLNIILVFAPAFFLLTVEAHAHPAWGIVVDNQGQVYFSDLATVWKIDAGGGLSIFREKGDRHTHDLNIDEAGNIYGADNSYEPSTQRFFSAIWKMTPAGSFSYLLPRTENPPPGTSIWRDRDGNTYHATNFPGNELLVLKRSRDGNVKVLVGNSKALQEFRQSMPYSIGGMAFDADGALYFTHGANVSKLTASGALTSLASNLTVEKASGNSAGGASPAKLFGIAVDTQRNAFVADYGNGRVLKIMPNGQTSTVLRAEELWFPSGVALKGSALYILEIGENQSHIAVGARVRKLLPDGRIVTLATVGENRTSSGNGSSGESSSSGSSERGGWLKHNIPYALIGAGTSIFALMIIVWLVWRRMYARQHGNT